MWVIVAGAWALGVPPLIVGAGALMTVNLPLGIVAIAATALILHRRSRRAELIDEAGFLRTIATSVSAGSSLRSAIRDGDRRVVTPRTRRLCDAGVPMAKIGRDLQPTLVLNGSTFAAVCAISERTGSMLAPTLHVLADRATAVADLRRHRGVATAQSRFSAGVVGLAPLGVTAGLIAMRGAPGDGNPIALASMVFGSAMQLAGVAVVFVMASRSVS